MLPVTAQAGRMQGWVRILLSLEIGCCQKESYNLMNSVCVHTSEPASVHSKRQSYAESKEEVGREGV